MAKEYIFQWSFQSAKEIEGRRAVYTVLLSSNGTLSCDCNGWIFPKKDAKKDGNGKKIRACKHTNHADVQVDYKKLFQKWKKGEPLPKIYPPSGSTGNATPVANSNSSLNTTSDLPFGRLVELD